jgi:Sec-independent protein translocase protein TatA
MGGGAPHRGGRRRRYGPKTNIGPLEVLILLLIVLLVVGGRRPPELGRALGNGYRSLRDHAGRRQPPKPELEPGEQPEAPAAERVEGSEPAKRP